MRLSKKKLVTTAPSLDSRRRAASWSLENRAPLQVQLVLRYGAPARSQTPRASHATEIIVEKGRALLTHRLSIEPLVCPIRDFPIPEPERRAFRGETRWTRHRSPSDRSACEQLLFLIFLRLYSEEATPQTQALPAPVLPSRRSRPVLAPTSCFTPHKPVLHRELSPPCGESTKFADQDPRGVLATAADPEFVGYFPDKSKLFCHVSCSRSVTASRSILEVQRAEHEGKLPSQLILDHTRPSPQPPPKKAAPSSRAEKVVIRSRDPSPDGQR